MKEKFKIRFWDKKKKEMIYEGGRPVVFDNGSFWVDESFAKDGSYLTLLAEWDEPIVVKGNIYEAPTEK